MRMSRKTMLRGLLGGAATMAGVDALPRVGDHVLQAAGSRPIVLSWLESDDAASLASLQKHAGLITHLSPTWFSMRDDLSIAGTVDPLVVQFAARHGLALHPLIHNDGFDAGVAGRILATSQQRAAAAQRIAALVLQNNFAGINMDFEGIFGAYKEQYADLIERLAARLHPAGKWVTVDVVPHLSPSAAHPINAWAAPYDFVRLGRACDAVVLMAYEYTGPQQPGSISPLWWVNQVIAFARTRIPSAKLVVGLPSYGREWVKSGSTTTNGALTQVEAQQFLSWTGASVSRPAREATPRFSWQIGNATHIVHYDDRTSLTAKLQAVDSGLAGIAFWRLGQEAQYQWDAVSSWAAARSRTSA